MKRTLLLFAATCFLMMKAEAQKGDWAAFGRYEKSNEVVKQLPQSKRQVVFMGNSITDMWIQSDSTFFISNNYIDRGIGGQTTSQMLVRFRKDVIDLHPQAVIILAGTNDIAGNTGEISLDNILGNIASMAELAKVHHIKVLLCSITPAFDYPWQKGLQPNIKIPVLNKMIEEFAKANDFAYVDYFSALNDGNNGMKKELATDGVHPTLEGYKIMEAIAIKAISKVLAQK
ncbi:MAG: SGNH/GDSL hydrolase family protein [Ginsengibacter sp.]